MSQSLTGQMADPARFLSSLAQTLATMSLYAEGHPARARVADASYEQLRLLQREDPTPSFSFLGTNVIYNQRSLRALRDWEWADRLGKAGVQRMEFDRGVERDAFHAFLDDVLARVAYVQGRADAPEGFGWRSDSSIRYGEVGVLGMNAGGEEEAGLDAAGVLPTWDLADEIETTAWMHEAVRGAAALPLAEAEGVVRSLALTMYAGDRRALPLVVLDDFEQYPTTHALNVSVLAMALADQLGLGAREVRAYGVAALLHDIGTTRVPWEILHKPTRLTDEEFAILQRHPADGARIILASDAQLELAAVVAFEHHMTPDGSGYPEPRLRRACHPASALVHVCDVADALRTRRPHRAAWGRASMLTYIEQGLGTEFDVEAGRAFLAMMREWDPPTGEGV